jgi:hypothetical protein
VLEFHRARLIAMGKVIGNVAVAARLDAPAGSVMTQGDVVAMLNAYSVRRLTGVMGSQVRFLSRADTVTPTFVSPTFEGSSQLRV